MQTNLSKDAECGVTELGLTDSVDGALDHGNDSMHVEGRERLGHGQVSVSSEGKKTKTLTY